MTAVQMVTKPTHQTTKERCRIHQLGLDARETLVVESVLQSNADLGARYTFGAPPPDDVADIVFVNGDDAVALADWQRLSRQHPATVPIFLTGSPEKFPGAHHVRRPFGLRNFLSSIEAITSTTGGFHDADVAASSPIRVLVVDDSFPARQFIQFKLEELAGGSLPLSIEFADSGELALHAVRSTEFDMVLLDVVMPGMDGYETCRQIKAVRPTRVALLTGRNASVDFARGREAGCDNYLTKPPNDADLGAILRLVALKKDMARR